MGSRSVDSVHEEPGEGDRLIRASAVTSVGVVFSRLTGLIRLAAVAAAIGVAESRLADSYNLANTMPNIIYELILGGLLSAVLVPVLVEVFERQSEDEAWRSASNLLNSALVVLVGVTVIGVVAAPWIASLYSSRLTGAEAALQHDVMTFLLRLFIPQVVFYGIAAIMTALMHAHRRFGLPMVSSIIGNLVVIGVFIGFRSAFGAVGLDATRAQLLVIGLGTTAGIAATALTQVLGSGFASKYRWSLSWRDPLIARVVKLSGFVVGFVLANHLGYVFMQWLANEEQGGFSAYLAAYTFFLVPIGLVGFSMGTALVPDMSSHALRENWDDFRARLSTAIRVMIFLLVPAAVAYVVIGRPLLDVSLEHGIMTARSIDLVADILAFMVLGLPQVAIFSLFVRAFYSMQETKTPFYVMAAMVVLHSAINVVLFETMGVEGLALGQAIVNTAAIFVFGRLMARRIGPLDISKIAGTGGRVIVAAAVMGALLWGVGRLVEDDLVVLAVGGIAGPVAYIAASRLLGLDEVTYLKRLLTAFRRSA